MVRPWRQKCLSDLEISNDRENINAYIKSDKYTGGLLPNGNSPFGSKQPVSKCQGMKMGDTIL